MSQHSTKRANKITGANAGGGHVSCKLGRAGPPAPLSSGVGFNTMPSEAPYQKNPCAEAVILVLRYCGAVLVAFAVSGFIMFAWAASTVGLVPFVSGSDPERLTTCFAVAYTGALAGVVSGSLCLAGRDRRLASLAILILGVGFYAARNNLFVAELPPAFAEQAARRPLLLPLALGGLSAVLISFLTSRGTIPNFCKQALVWIRTSVARRR
jgi:hypothetical protein